MKKYLIGCLLGFGLSTLIAFKIVNYESKMSTSEVNKIEGLYIFTDSNPVTDFDSIGTVDINFLMDTQYESIRNNFIKRAKKKFPNADGLIMSFSKKGVDKFK
jgi:hypothetical protein